MLAGVLTATLEDAAQARAQATPPTFSRDVAPILFTHCASCHGPDGPAPFSLLTYADVRPRAAQIAAAARRRAMPPWKPDPGVGSFVGERRLSDAQIAMLEAWVAGGGREGDRADLPQPPRQTRGWQLGTPDLILALPEYLLPAGGVDEFRNFVVPVPGDETRFVRGLEFHPHSPQVHHANVFVDPTGTSRQMDDADPLPGYDGVIPYAAAFPDGHFLGWTPGQIAPLEPDGQSWRLAPGSSLLVQLHMMRGETAAIVRPAIGLYFSKTPPSRTPAMLRLGRQNLDIAPGDASYLSEDSYVLPVDAEIQAVQPHAHQRAKDVKAWATLPDGARRELISISQWDFGWQDQYRYKEPFWLPAGTRLSLEYRFDNSASNRRNPDRPPRRVLWGNRSADEMADLWIQMSTRSEPDLTRLSADLRGKMILEDIAGHETELRSRPESIIVRNDVAVLYLEAGRPAQAAAHFAAVVGLQPTSAVARFNLAAALQRAGRDGEALAQYREAAHLDPEYGRAVKGLAEALLVAGDAAGAATQYERWLRQNPDDAESLNNLGFARAQKGDLSGARAALERSLALRPSSGDAHFNLGRVLVATLIASDAATHLSEAIRLHEDWAPALTELAWLRATAADASVRQPLEAIRLAERAAVVTARRDADVLDALAFAYASAGRFDEARTTAEEGLSLPALGTEVSARLQAHLLAFRERRLPARLGRQGPP